MRATTRKPNNYGQLRADPPATTVRLDFESDRLSKHYNYSGYFTSASPSHHAISAALLPTFRAFFSSLAGGRFEKIQPVSRLEKYCSHCSVATKALVHTYSVHLYCSAPSLHCSSMPIYDTTAVVPHHTATLQQNDKFDKHTNTLLLVRPTVKHNKRWSPLKLSNILFGSQIYPRSQFLDVLQSTFRVKQEGLLNSFFLFSFFIREPPELCGFRGVSP